MEVGGWGYRGFRLNVWFVCSHPACTDGVPMGSGKEEGWWESLEEIPIAVPSLLCLF